MNRKSAFWTNWYLLNSTFNHYRINILFICVYGRLYTSHPSHKLSPCNFKRIEIIKNGFSQQNGVKLESDHWDM